MQTTSHHPMARAAQTWRVPGKPECKDKATPAQLRRRDRRVARQALRNGQEV